MKIQYEASAMTVPDEKLRGEFETAVRFYDRTFPLTRVEEGRYLNDRTNIAFEDIWKVAYAAGYQACKKQAAEYVETHTTLGDSDSGYRVVAYDVPQHNLIPLASAIRRLGEGE